MLSGNVAVASEKLFLSGDSVEVSTVDDTLVASGQVKYQDDSYLISGDSLSAVQKNDEIQLLQQMPIIKTILQGMEVQMDILN